MRRCLCGFSALVVTAAVLMPAPVAGAAPAVVPKPLCCIPTGNVTAIAIDGNTAYVGGDFHHMGIPTSRLAVLDPSSGQPQAGWPSVDGGFVLASVGDGSGGWYIGGTFTSVGGLPHQHIAHLRPDRSVDPDWAASVNGFSVDALARQGGVVYAGGLFSDVNGGTTRTNFAAFDETTGAVTGLVMNTDGMVRALATSSRPELNVGNIDRLYLGGDFSNVNGSARGKLAAVDLATDTLLATDPKLNGSVYTLGIRYPGFFVNDPAIVYAGGDMTVADLGSSNLPRGNGVAYNDLLQIQSWDPGANSRVEALAVGSTNVYLGGGFTALHSDLRTRLGAVSSTTGATASWTATVAGFFAPDVRSVVLQGGNVYVGGRFTSANTEQRSNLAAFNAGTGALTSWDPDPPGFNIAIQHLDGDGSSLLTSGEFEAIGGAERHHLAAIDLATGQVLPFNPDLDDGVNALAVQGGTLYAAGTFQHVGGGATIRHNAAAFDTTSGQPTAFDPNTADEVFAVAPAGGTVFLGGGFSQLNGGTARVGLAEVDAQSGAVTSFKQDLDGGALALALRDDTVFVGGQFDHMGGVARRGFAAAKFAPGTLGALTPLDLGLDNSNSGFADVRALLVRGSTIYVTGTFNQVLGQSRLANLAFNLSANELLPFDPHADFYPTSLAADELNLFTAGQFQQFGGAPRLSVASVDQLTGTANDWVPGLPPDGAIVTVGTSPAAGVLIGGNAVGTTHRAQGILLAFALQPASPAAPQASAGEAQASVSFSAPADGGSPITQYKVTAAPGGQTATGSGSPIAVTGLTPGTAYTFTVSAANAAGESPQSPPSNSVTPTSAAGGPAPPAAGGAALTASGFKVTNKRFQVAKRATPLSAKKTPKGTTFVFRLSAAATSRIAIARKLPGRKKGKRCVAPRKSLKKKCTRYVKAGTLVRKRTKAGANRVPFSGRMGKRALRPGTYRATLTASDPSGRRSKPLILTFRVVKR